MFLCDLQLETTINFDGTIFYICCDTVTQPFPLSGFLLVVADFIHQPLSTLVMPVLLGNPVLSRSATTPAFGSFPRVWSLVVPSGGKFNKVMFLGNIPWLVLVPWCMKKLRRGQNHHHWHTWFYIRIYYMRIMILTGINVTFTCFSTE